MTNREIETKNITFNHVKLIDKHYISNSELLKSCKKYENLLEPYCGPFAKYGCIISGTYGNAYTVDIFTKDGITLVSSTTPENFVDVMLQRILVTIGQKVDITAHDGTTTAMLLFLKIISSWFENKISPNEDDAKYPFDLERTFNTVLEIIDFCSLTIEEFIELCHDEKVELSDMDIKKTVVYNTAMISSKGNEKLSTAIADYICYIPKELYTGSWSLRPFAYESETSYLVTKAECDLQLLGVHYHTDKRTFLNQDSNTTGHYEDCDLIFTGSDSSESTLHHLIMALLIHFDDLPMELVPRGYENAKDFIKSINGSRAMFGIPVDYEQTKPLVVCVSERNNIYLDHLVEYFTTRTGVPVIFMQYPANMTPVINNLYINSIYASADKLPLICDEIKMDEIYSKSIIHGVTVDLYSGLCNLSNISVKSDDADDIYHPFFHDQDNHPFYKKVMTVINNIDHKILASPDKKIFHDNERAIFTDIKHLMIAKYRMTLQYSGYSHQLASDKTVVEDSLGASMSVLVDGFMLDGYNKILAYLHDFNERLSSNTIINNAIDKVLNVIYGSNISYGRIGSLMDYIMVDSDRVVRTYDFMKELKHDQKDTRKHTALIQPKKGFTSQFVRYKDLVQKLLNTEDFIDTRTAQPSSNQEHLV